MRILSTESRTSKFVLKILKRRINFFLFFLFLSKNNILILEETKNRSTFVKNKINKKIFSIDRLPKSIIIPSEENLNFVKKLEKEIEDKYF